MTEPNFDLQEAHRHFSKMCFNRAWDFIDKPDRTTADEEEMLQLALSSLWHWSQRSDCSDKNLSIGYWQASRVYALVADGGNATKYANLCLMKTPQDDPFLLGYAHEALARAALIQGDPDEARTQQAKGLQYAEAVSDAESRQMLIGDLKTLG